MKSISHTKAFEMAIPIEDLFPLFSPEGEKYWVPGWDYDKANNRINTEWQFHFAQLPAGYAERSMG